MSWKTIVQRRIIGTLLAGAENMWLVLEGQEKEINPEPLQLTDDVKVPVGTKFSRLAGSKTSSGFTNIEMLDDHYMVYKGILHGLDGNLAMFQIEPEPFESVMPCFWYNTDTKDGDGYFIHITPGNASRVVELTDCKYTIN